jgi:hypothetical protein
MRKLLLSGIAFAALVAGPATAADLARPVCRRPVVGRGRSSRCQRRKAAGESPTRELIGLRYQVAVMSEKPPVGNHGGTRFSRARAAPLSC